MTGDIDPLLLSIMFSGFKSRCITLSLCITSTPLSTPNITSLTSSSEKYPLRSFMRWSSCPPPSTSCTTQIEFYDQYTPYKRSRFGWFYLLSLLTMHSSFIRLYLPFLAEKQFCFEKAFTANLRLSVTLSTSQTDAKLPLPSFLSGLKSQWKPSWLRWDARQMFQAQTMGEVEQRVKVRVLSQRNLNPFLADLMFFYCRIAHTSDSYMISNLRSKDTYTYPKHCSSPRNREESSRALGKRASVKSAW